jgi:hypothetical protein
MVGGIVVEVIKLEDRVWVDCKDAVYLNDPTTAVYVVRNAVSELIRPGDKLWWQGDSAFWTTPDLKHVEVELERVGSSGVGRPAGY